MRVARARLRVPPGVQEGRRHRHGLLPPPRPQRGRRPVDDPAADVRPDRGEALGAQALHRVAHRPRRHHRRGGRAGAARLPGAARAGLHRDPRGVRVAGRTAPARLEPPAEQPTPVGTTRASPTRGRQADRRRRRSTCPTASPCTRKLLPQLQRRARWSTDGGIDWAMGEMLAFGSLLLEGTPGPAGRAGHAGAARSASGTPCSSTARPARSTRRWRTSTRTRRRSTSTTRCCRSSPRWASSTATRSPGRRRWCCGRRSSATSPTARSRSSTSSSPSVGAEVGPALRRRAAAAARLRGPGARPLVRRASSASCSCAPRTT